MTVSKEYLDDASKTSRNDGENCAKTRDGFFLYFAAFAGSLSLIGGGCSVVWTSPVIPTLQSNNTDINPLGYPVRSYDLSLIVGTLAIGNLIVPIFCSKLMDGIGRKNTLVVFGICNLIFFIVLAYARSLLWILISRLMTGIALGGIMIAVPVYLSEITEDHNRGKFGCLMGLFMPLGQLYGYIIGSYFSIKYFTLLCTLPIAVHTLLLVLVIPETPPYLLYRGKTDLALKSMKRYRSNQNPNEIEKSVQIMDYMMKQMTKNKKPGWLTLFQHPTTRRGFFIGLGMIMVQMGTGVPVLMSFMGPIFEEAQTGLSGNNTSILVGVLKITTFLFVAQVVERLGRKPLMLFSTVFSGISLFVLGGYFFMKENNFDGYRSYAWVPVATVMFFVLVYSMGLGPIPLATVSELFAVDIRSTAFSTIGFFGTIFNTIVLSSFPIVVKYMGISGCMWFFSACCVLGVLFVYFIMPETKGKSIYEIQELLSGRSSQLGNEKA